MLPILVVDVSSWSIIWPNCISMWVCLASSVPFPLFWKTTVLIFLGEGRRDLYPTASSYIAPLGKWMPTNIVISLLKYNFRAIINLHYGLHQWFQLTIFIHWLKEPLVWFWHCSPFWKLQIIARSIICPNLRIWITFWC